MGPRNRGRTALGIVSMAIAPIIFLSSATLSSGYPAAAFLAARQLMGGDILLLPGKNALSQQDLAAGGYTWRFQKRGYDSPDITMGFDNAPYSYGTVQGFPTSASAGVSADRYREVLLAVQADASVKAASIRRSLPFLQSQQGGDQA